MSRLHLYNSLTRHKDVFEPIDASHIKMYVCGPTVYNYAHIGNARAAVTFDNLYRLLKTLYPQVTYVRNITDIDDKIIEAAIKENKTISDITTHYAQIYNDDMGALGVQNPTIQPKATDHIDGMVNMISRLIEMDHAYESRGHVLFHVPSYTDYGRLSGRNRDEQIAGARVEVADYKKDPADFILWKPSDATQPGWDSPWGRGRPGWHIECSVMAKEFLGNVFDIHGGGLDLTFPHHENEIAQSCCANNETQMANYWVHNGFVTVEGEKMSKSLGNVTLPHDLIAKGFKGEAIRLALLTTHYRQPFDWTQSGLDQATKTLDKWYELIRDDDGGEDDHQNDLHDGFMDALCDDLNTPKAISVLHSLAKDNPAMLKRCANIIGLLSHSHAEWTESTHRKIAIDDHQILDLIHQRNAARTAKDFAKSDQIRDDLLSMGITIKDNRDGTTDWFYN